MFRPRVIVAFAAAGALGFVMLRVLYRMVFGGAGGGSTVLWSLDTLSLPGPFSHVALGGTVTLEGLQGAVLSALPFALVILATGSLVALYDPRRILFTVSPSSRGSSLLVALGLALGTLPFLFREAHALRQSLALRGVRGGIRILVPLLERTLEHAIGLAKTLEFRGVWVRPHSNSSSKDVSIRFDDVSVPSRGLGPLNWHVPNGSRTVLTGATGSGKTSVLELMTGVLGMRGDAPVEGHVSVPHRTVAYLPHDPRTVFLTSRVIDDVALSVKIAGSQEVDVLALAGEVLGRSGLVELADRSPDSLSSGEQILAALQVLIAANPAVLVLDEPLSSLSEDSAGLFLDQVNEFATSTGATVVLTDHPKGGEELEGFTYWQLGEGGVTQGRYQAPPFHKTLVPFAPAEPDVVLSVTDLTIERDDHVILRSVNLDVGRGELVAVVGDNGAGKTTLLETIARAESSSIQVRGEYVQDVRPLDRPRSVALIPSRPSDLFVRASVAEELAFADTTARVNPGFSEATWWCLVSVDNEDERQKMLGRHPRDLSRGQQTALALTLQLSFKPAVVLLDEPFRGLDESAEAVMAEVIGCVLETGTAVVIATHHSDHLPLRWDRTVTLERGALQSARTGS